MFDKSKKRVKVTGVTLNLLYPNGESRTVTLDPRHTEAIFWSERAVMEILAPFYEKESSVLTPEKIVESFGPQAKKVVGKKKKVTVSKNVVEELWNLEDAEGYLPGLMAKTLECGVD